MNAFARKMGGAQGSRATGALLCLAALGAACGRPPRGSLNAPVLAEEQLQLPPGSREEAILRRARRSGGCADGREAARLLLDLHDAAALLSGEQDEVSSRQRRVGKAVEALLRRELGVQELAPRAELLEKLRARFRALPRACGQKSARLSAGALRLLALDALEAPEGPAAFRWATELRRRVIEGGPLATNARVRLLGRCVRSFRHALREVPRRQRRVLSRCLFGLFEADPAPYFSADPAQRPPAPPWTLLRRHVLSGLRLVARSRLSALSKLQIEADEAFFKQEGVQLPAAVDISKLQLPASSQGRPFDDTPVVTAMAEIFVVDGLVVQRGDDQALRRAIRKRLRGDRRGALTVVMGAGLSAAAIYELGRAAQREKVHTLALGVRRLVARKAALGDVQASMVGTGPVWRLEGIPVSVRLLALRPGDTDRDRPRALLYDPLAAEARLALVCSAKSWRLESRYGALRPLRAGDIAGLRRQLLRLQRVFPDEGGLILAAAHGLTFAQLVRVVEHVRYAGRTPLFPAVALAQRFGLGSGARAMEELLIALEGARVEHGGRLSLTARASLRACCRRALARAFGAEEAPIPLMVPRRKRRGKASVGVSAWGACLAAPELAWPQAPRCIPGKAPAPAGDGKSMP